MKRKIFLIIIITILAVLYGGYYFCLPAVLNTQKFENFVEKKLHSQLGYNIDFSEPHFKTGIIPSVIFKASEINLYNDDGSKAFSVLKPNIRLRLLPLLIKNIEIKNLDAEALVANVVYDKNETIRLGQYPIKFGNKSIFELTRLSVDVNQYGIILYDENKDKTIKLYGDYFKINKYRKNKILSVSTDAKLFTEGKTASVTADVDIPLPFNKVSEDKARVDVSVINLDISNFSEYVNILSKGKVKSLRGIINFHSNTEIVNGHKNIKSLLMIDKLGIMGKDRASSIYSNYPLEVTQNIHIIDDGVKIDNVRVMSEGIDFYITGGVYKTKNKFPTLDLHVSARNISGANLLPLFPGSETLNPDFNFYKLKEHMIYGKAKGNIDIKGEANYPNLYGSALLTDVYLNHPIKDAPQNGVIKLFFNQHTMNIDVHVFTDKNEYVDVKGSFKLFRDRYSDMVIKSTQNIDLVKAYSVIMPLRDIFKFELGPIPMMDIPAGFGNADFRISGSREDPHAWGKINFRDGIASFITINNMVAKNINGWVKFDGDNVTFKTTSTKLNNLPVEIDGTCSMKGNLSVNVKGDGQNSENLLKIINTSPILSELQAMLKPITYASGKTKVFLNIFGHVDRGKEPVFNKDLFAKGSVEFLSNKMTFFPEKVPASNISGIVNFDRQDGNFKIDANLVNSPISTNGFIKNNVLTANAYSNKFNAGDGWHIAHLFYGDRILPVPGMNTISTSFSGHYKGIMSVDKFDYSKIVAKGRVYSNLGSKSHIIVNNSEFDIKKGHVHLTPIRGMFRHNPFNLQIDIDNLMTPKQIYNGYFSMKNFDISSLNGLDIPEYPQLKDFDDFSGKIDIASKIKDNNIRLYTQLGNTSCVYKPKKLKIKIADGNVLYDSNNLNLNRINGHLGEMPMFVNGKISKLISDNPSLDLYLTAKPTQEFFDQFYNYQSVYPVKLKGDVILLSKLDGPLDKLGAKTEIKLDEDSSLYYMGATIGDLTNSVDINIDSVSGKNWVKLNSFKYDKIITSQNGKKFPNNQLTASGGIQMLADNNFKFNNFKVKTNNPTDAKIFNIIFKKPFMKQGVFTSDLTVNGTSLSPKILGDFSISSIDVPMLNATVKDLNLDFKPNNIFIKAKSSLMENEIFINADVQNKLHSPYVVNNLDIDVDKLDLNEILKSLENYDATLYKQNYGMQENNKTPDDFQIIVKSGTIKADKIKIQELVAENFVTDFSIGKDMLAAIKDYSFKLADGTVEGDGKYSLKNNKLDFNTHIKNFNAQSFADSLINLKSQFYGTLNGDMSISCTGQTQEECIKTLSGKGNFVISDGRMPKLGSLEYLLKATNTVTSGITRISINNIIDLITPLKTGQFKSITGNFNINNGKVEDLEIFSKGKDLNLYLSGSYDIETYVANMEVYGTLSANLTSVSGKLKNFSLNTLLNTLPFLNKNEFSPEVSAKINKIPSDENFSVSRIFAAIIDGDINGMSYVKSFKWVK